MHKIKAILVRLIMLATCMLSASVYAINVTTTELGTTGNRHFVSQVYTVDIDLDPNEAHYLHVEAPSLFNNGKFTLILNNVVVFEGTPTERNNTTSRWDAYVKIDVKKGDKVQALIDSNEPVSSETQTTASILITVSEEMPGYPAKWTRNESFVHYTTQCSATVPVSIDLGSLSPGSDKTVDIPLMVSSQGLVGLRIDNDQGVITLKNAAGSVLSLDLSQYYNSADNTIRWQNFSDTTISARVNVPKESALGLATITGSFTLDCI